MISRSNIDLWQVFLPLTARMLRAGQSIRIWQQLKPSKFHLARSQHRTRSKSLTSKYPSIRKMTTSAAINAERFLADRTAPVCSLEIGTSFAQLR